MLLCLDMGNSQIYGGVFSGDALKCVFRFNSQQSASSDELGVFLRAVLRENDIALDQITGISCCSVVPERDYSLRAACLKYLSIDPFVVKPGVKTGLKVLYKNAKEVGADRIANAIAVTHHFHHKNVLVVDFGTATTVCAIDAEHNYLGGVIMPGMKISMEALRNNTAKLPYVEIAKPEQALGRSSIESIQSGIYHMQLATIASLKKQLSQGLFKRGEVVMVGTGGFAYLFEEEGLFDAIVPDLVLQGLRLAYQMNVDEMVRSTDKG